MNAMTRTWGCCLAGVVLAYPAATAAQDKPAGYPNRPIRLVISGSPGAGGDMMARAVTQMLTDAWGQNAVVDHRPGGSGLIAAELAAKAAPDGYTLLSGGENLMLLGVLKRAPFDILKAFDPVTPTSAQPYILMVHPSMPFKSIKELVAYSASRRVTYSGSSGVGATVHLGMERLAQLSGANLRFIAYKGSAPSILAAMGGEINMVASSSLSATAAIQTGKLRALAALSLTRVPSMPDLPTVAEQGYPGFKITNRYGLRVPAGTPRAIIAAINRVVGERMHSPQMREKLEAEGAQPAERMTPEQFKATLAREFAELEQTVKRLDIKIQ
ncbi:MAG: tripartite tricarboxylate transporter substrate binding protein [Pseudomonadota bacterium]